MDDINKNGKKNLVALLDQESINLNKVACILEYLKNKLCLKQKNKAPAQILSIW
jgi:hypothetical protein